MTRKKYKRGKIPLKHFGKRLMIVSRAGTIGVRSYHQPNVSIYISPELAYTLRPLVKSVDKSREVSTLTGLEREAYDQIVRCYLHSRERSLVDRAFTQAVKRARVVLSKIWEVNLVDSEFYGPEQSAFAAAEYYWQTSLENALRVWDPKLRSFELR